MGSQTLPRWCAASKARRLPTPIDLGTLDGFPNPPAMVRGEQSPPAPHASLAPLDRRDRRRAATSSHAGASPARSSFVPLSERLGPGLPNRRAGFDSLAVLETACVDPVMPHGVARTARPPYQSEANGKPGG